MPARYQVVAIPRHPPPGHIVGRGAKHPFDIRDLSDAQVAVLGLAQEERQVQPFGRQVDLPVRQAQTQADLGVVGQELRHQRRDQPPPDAQGGRHVKRSAQVLGDIGDLRLGGFDGGQDLGRAAIEGLPLFRGRQAARGALEQPHAQVILKLGNPRRRHRRRDPQIAPRGGHAAQFIDTNEGADIVEIGHSSDIFDAA